MSIKDMPLITAEQVLRLRDRAIALDNDLAKALQETAQLKAAMKWLFSRDTGLSSTFILQHMIGAKNLTPDHPGDDSDLGRCFRLLDRFPEWELRIGELAKYSPEWADIVARWDHLRKTVPYEKRDQNGVEV